MLPCTPSAESRVSRRKDSNGTCSIAVGSCLDLLAFDRRIQVHPKHTRRRQVSCGPFRGTERRPLSEPFALVAILGTRAPLPHPLQEPESDVVCSRCLHSTSVHSAYNNLHFADRSPLPSPPMATGTNTPQRKPPSGGTLGGGEPCGYEKNWE